MYLRRYAILLVENKKHGSAKELQLLCTCAGDMTTYTTEVTQADILIRTPVENIKETSNRATQGVIVMRFKEEGDQVISMALTDREDTQLPETTEA